MDIDKLDNQTMNQSCLCLVASTGVYEGESVDDFHDPTSRKPVHEHLLAGLRSLQEETLQSSRTREYFNEQNLVIMAASLQMMDGWQHATLADWAREQDNDRLAILWKQLTVAVSHYKPEMDSLDLATAIAARLETVRIEIEQRGGLPGETFEPSPWYKSFEEKADWTLTDFTKLPKDTEFDVQRSEPIIEKQDQRLNLLLQPVYATTEATLPDAADETRDFYGTFLDLNQAATENAEQDLFLPPMNIHTATDPYEAYRVSDNDLSGLPIISCRMTPSVADLWLGDGLFSSPMQPETPFLDCALPDMQNMSQQVTLKAPQLQAAKASSQVQPMFSMKRKVPWLENDTPGPWWVSDATDDIIQAGHNESPAPKRQKTAESPGMSVRNSSFDDSIHRVLEKKKGPALKTKWLTYTQARRIPQTVKDDYHKGAWQKIADTIGQNKRNR
ncbi:hypothetical protein LTR70_002777 [Exophiala xenobiotica]|uniref:Uncharacterized protein n=1 Tax=Lithohypha guttulata TaxID=1690604 RepID=A0ABR0KJ64_9EURO|nr:hypothetical protein LTR24_001991 [Lithohypha guttulata]KAK5324494.1 hypothetical protein LTR70_002777 [Exophiala xenobiotica]